MEEDEFNSGIRLITVSGYNPEVVDVKAADHNGDGQVEEGMQEFNATEQVENTTTTSDPLSESSLSTAMTQEITTVGSDNEDLLIIETISKAKEITQVVQIDDDDEGAEFFICICCANSTCSGGGVKQFSIQDRLSSLSSPERKIVTVSEALSLIFDFPSLVARGKGQIFTSDSHEQDTLCQKCAPVFIELYSMYQKFTDMLESKGRILEKINEQLRQTTTLTVTDITATPEARESSSYQSRLTRKPLQKDEMVPTEGQVRVVVTSLMNVDHNNQQENQQNEQESASKRKRGRPPKNKPLQQASPIKVKRHNPTILKRNDPSAEVHQKQRNNTTIEDDDEDFESHEEMITSDFDEWSPTAASNPNTPTGKSGKKVKSEIVTRRSIRSLPSSSAAAAAIAATMTLKTGKTPRPKTKERETLTETQADEQPTTITNKRIRNWKKESWIEKAQQDPTRTCDLCDKSFIFPAVMMRHKKIVHQGLKPFECQSCGKRFTQKVILNKHTCDFSKEAGNRDFLQMTREEELRKFVCKVCNKRFKYPTHLTLHEMNHRDERPYPCEQCEKSFRRPDHLKYHVRIVHVEEKKFICTTCGQSLKSISSLRAHEKKHTSDQGHLCNICGKSIKSMYQMSRHQKTHQDELPFECPVCQKRFKMKDYLGQHLRRGRISCAKKLLSKGNSSCDSILPDIPTDPLSLTTEENENDVKVDPTHSSNYNSDSNAEGKEGDNPLPAPEMTTIPMEFACFPSPAVNDERLLTEL